MLRVVKASDVDIVFLHYATDEETLADSGGGIVWTVERADGTALTGATVAVNNGADGKYDLVLDDEDHLSQLDILKINVASVDTGHVHSDDIWVKIVGKRFFKIADLRAMPGLNDTSIFPNDLLRDARDAAEDFVEDYTQVAWVQQYRREIYDGGGGASVLYLERVPARELLKVVIDGVTQTTTDWSLSDSGRIIASGASFSASAVGQNIEVQYVTGYDEPPSDLRLATLRLAKHIALSDQSSIPDRARMMQTEWGLFHLNIASADHPTGLPEVDSVLTRLCHEQPITIV